MEVSEKNSSILMEEQDSETSIVEVPEELRKALLDFSVAFLTDKPKDVVDYAVNYFTHMQNYRKKMRETVSTIASNRADSDGSTRLTFNTERRLSYLKSSKDVPDTERGVLDRVSLENMHSYRPSLQRESVVRKSVTIHRNSEKSIDKIDHDDYLELFQQISAQRMELARRKSRDPERKSKDTSQRNSDRKSSTLIDFESKSSDYDIPRRVSERRESERRSRDSERKSKDLRGSLHRISDRRSSSLVDLKRKSSDHGSRRSSSERRESGRKSRDSPQRGSRRSSSITHYWYRTEPLPRRKSIYVDPFNPDYVEDIEEIIPFVVPKTPELQKRLKKAIKNVLIFQSLDSQQMNQLLDALVEKRVTAGEVVALQGSEATDLYVIDKGVFVVYRDGEHVYTFYNHGVFGELALISTKVRLATIIAETDGILWCIDRQRFHSILQTKAYHRRNFYEKELQKVFLLQVLTKYELMNLADAIIEKIYKQGEAIFKQGDAHNGMYIVVEGVVQIKAKDKKGIDRDMRKIAEGEKFFGELALLKIQEKRVTSAYAASPIVKLAFLDIDSFERIVGDSLQVVRRSIGITHPHYADLDKFYKSKNVDVKLF